MNARGSTEVIVASIGLSMGALSQNLFTMIVAMAVVTTMAMPPMLRWALRAPAAPARRRARGWSARRSRPGGFVTNLERLLVAVDGSAKGSFASRLAGLLAGIARHAGHRPRPRQTRRAARLRPPGQSDADALAESDRGTARAFEADTEEGRPGRGRGPDARGPKRRRPGGGGERGAQGLRPAGRSGSSATSTPEGGFHRRGGAHSERLPGAARGCGRPRRCTRTIRSRRTCAS